MVGAGAPWYRRLFDLLLGVARHALADNVPTLAGALTYYALLALFPALIVVVGLLTLVGREATTGVLTDVLGQLLPAEAAQALEEPVERLVADRSGAGTLLGAGFVLAVWSASGYVGAFVWAARHVYDVESGGPFLHGIARRLGFALIILVLLAVLSVVLVASGPVVDLVADALDIDEGALRAYGQLRWPLLIGGAVLLFGVLYAAAPAARAGGVRLLTVGSALAVVVWLGATAVFDLYVTRFADYGVVYGALGGVIVFLLWLWISNIALLLGAELNAELARRRAGERRRRRRRAARGGDEEDDGGRPESGDEEDDGERPEGGEDETAAAAPPPTAG